MWDIFINPMVTALALMYSVFGNNVILAIVALTVVIRMLMYPIMAQQQASSEKMKDVQPRLKKLQEKYKDDREKLAQAQMELYKEAGVNPVGGCLPMFLQFPIFIGLYQAIFFALAATPYQLVDLSERLLIPGLDGLIPLQNIWLGMRLTEPPAPPANPIYALALPLLVAVTTYFQFRMSQSMMTPQADDDETPNQMAAMSKSMGTFMPLMFGFISLSLSVGLSVYFITGNIVGIIQYSPAGRRILDRVFMRKSPEKKAEEAAAAAAAEEDAKPAKALKSSKGKKGKAAKSS